MVYFCLSIFWYIWHSKFTVVLSSVLLKVAEVFCKKGKHLHWKLFFSKKETLTQVFACGYCKILMKTYFEKHLRTTACNISPFSLKTELLQLVTEISSNSHKGKINKMNFDLRQTFFKKLRKKY